MSTARGRLWRRLVESGRWGKADVMGKIGGTPKKQDMLDACEALSVEAPAGATNPELYQLLQQA